MPQPSIRYNRPEYVISVEVQSVVNNQQEIGLVIYWDQTGSLGPARVGHSM